MKNRKQDEKPRSLNGYQRLETYNDYSSLIEKVVNGVLDGSVERQDAHTIAILTGYGLQAIKSASGGKMRMSVFLQDVHQHNINLTGMTREQMDRFLQGSEQMQLEVLQEVHNKDNTIDATIKALPMKVPAQKLDKEAIAELSGLTQDQVTEVFIKKPKNHKRPKKHKWMPMTNEVGRFCKVCGLQRDDGMLSPEDLEALCSGTWGGI